MHGPHGALRIAAHGASQEELRAWPTRQDEIGQHWQVALQTVGCGLEPFDFSVQPQILWFRQGRANVKQR